MTGEERLSISSDLFCSDNVPVSSDSCMQNIKLTDCSILVSDVN